MRTGALERHSFGSFDAVEGLAKRQLSWVPKLEMDSLTSVPASHYRADKLKRWFMVPIRDILIDKLGAALDATASHFGIA